MYPLVREYFKYMINIIISSSCDVWSLVICRSVNGGSVKLRILNLL